MDYKKLIGYGIIIWVIPYILSMAFLAYNVFPSIWAIITLLIMVAFLAYFFGGRLNLNLQREAFKYSAGWVIIAIILDMIFTTPYSGWGLFSQWNIILTYLIILLLPVLAVRNK